MPEEREMNEQPDPSTRADAHAPVEDLDVSEERGEAVRGGATDMFLKIDGIQGESTVRSKIQPPRG